MTHEEALHILRPFETEEEYEKCCSELKNNGVEDDSDYVENSQTWKDLVEWIRTVGLNNEDKIHLVTQDKEPFVWNNNK